MGGEETRLNLRRYSLEVAGREKRWSFDIWAEPRHVEDWRADGLEILPVVGAEWLTEDAAEALRPAPRAPAG